MSWSGKVHKTICNQGHWVRVCVFQGYQTKTHNQKQHTKLHSLTKPRLFSVNQANIKQDTANKKLKRIWKKCLNCQPFVHYPVFNIFTVTCITFRSFEWLYFVQKGAWLTENFLPKVQCLEKPNSRSLMIVKHKPLNQILEKPKSRIPMFEKPKFQKFTV